MPTPATRIGDQGNVSYGASAVSEMTKWSLDESANLKEYSSAQSSGNMRAVKGVKQCSGSVECMYDFDDPIDASLKSGDSVTLTLTLRTGRSYSVPALVENGPNLVVDNGEIVAATFTWKSNGVWTYPDGTTSAAT